MSIEQQQKNALGILWRCFDFNKSAIARAAGVTRMTVNDWFNRGRISATGALKIENHPKVKGVITKEEMRPDVNEWFGL